MTLDLSEFLGKTFRDYSFSATMDKDMPIYLSSEEFFSQSMTDYFEQMSSEKLKDLFREIGPEESESLYFAVIKLLNLQVVVQDVIGHRNGNIDLDMLEHDGDILKEVIRNANQETMGPKV